MKKTFKEFEEFVRNIAEEKFYYDQVVFKSDEHGCGTVCCAAGWLPNFDGEAFKYVNYGGVEVTAIDSMGSLKYAMAYYFEMPVTVIRDIFFNVETYDYELNIPPAMVADKMLEYINSK